MSTPSPSVPSVMSEALGRLWTKFLPEIENRLVVVESATLALDAGTLTAEGREAASQAAHKLAGVLGTFGLQRGTDLARQIEVLLDLENSAASAADLSLWTSELRLLIDGRK